MSYRTPDGLLRDVHQQRITPKSEFLLRLEQRQAKAKVRVVDPTFDDDSLPELLRRMAQ